jgi:hypothetical protein
MVLAIVMVIYDRDGVDRDGVGNCDGDGVTVTFIVSERNTYGFKE